MEVLDRDQEEVGDGSWGSGREPPVGVAHEEESRGDIKGKG